MKTNKDKLISEINMLLKQTGNYSDSLAFADFCLKNKLPMPEEWSIEKLEELKGKLENA